MFPQYVTAWCTHTGSIRTHVHTSRACSNSFTHIYFVYRSFKPKKSRECLLLKGMRGLKIAADEGVNELLILWIKMNGWNKISNKRVHTHPPHTPLPHHTTLHVQKLYRERRHKYIVMCKTHFVRVRKYIQEHLISWKHVQLVPFTVLSHLKLVCHINLLLNLTWYL